MPLNSQNVCLQCAPYCSRCRIDCVRFVSRHFIDEHERRFIFRLVLENVLIGKDYKMCAVVRVSVWSPVLATFKSPTRHATFIQSHLFWMINSTCMCFDGYNRYIMVMTEATWMPNGKCLRKTDTFYLHFPHWCPSSHHTHDYVRWSPWVVLSGTRSPTHCDGWLNNFVANKMCIVVYRKFSQSTFILSTTIHIPCKMFSATIVYTNAFTDKHTHMQTCTRAGIGVLVDKK